MQNIFAYRQSREANFELGINFIKEHFLPDLNSMEVQDSQSLVAQRDESVKIYKENYKNSGFQSLSGSTDRINDATTTAVRDYHANKQKDFLHFKKNMIAEAEKIFDRYVSVLNLLIQFRQFADDDTKMDHSNYVKNLLIEALKENKSLENISLRRNINWDKYKGEVRNWFKELVKKDKDYIAYLNLKDTSFDQDKAVVNHIVKNIIFKSDLIDKYLEEQDLNWSEDRAIIKSLVTKTIKDIEEESGAEFDLQELSYNWEDDKTFFKKLYEEANRVEQEYAGLIDLKTKNWDIDRIALTDKIILEMAISEMINFPSIPVKVTINEYIEVAKKYSTPKSKIFINGVLDVIANDLVERGVIKKSGRGLIDNK